MRVKRNSIKGLALIVSVMMCVSMFLFGQSVLANDEVAEQDPKVVEAIEKQENTKPDTKPEVEIIKDAEEAKSSEKEGKVTSGIEKPKAEVNTEKDGERNDNNMAPRDSNNYVYKIRIIKVEKGNEQKKLAGAVFEVKRVPSGDVVGTITTGADGEGELGGLLKDSYAITEVTPPKGYELSQEVIVIDIRDFKTKKTAVITFANELAAPETVEVTVKKVWVGEPSDGAKISLTRDGETVETVDVGIEEGWSYTFKDLLKTDPIDGHDYIYDVMESGLEGSYETERETPSEGVYIFTNTKIDQVPVPITPDENNGGEVINNNEDEIDNGGEEINNSAEEINSGGEVISNGGEEINNDGEEIAGSVKEDNQSDNVIRKIKKKEPSMKVKYYPTKTNKNVPMTGDDMKMYGYIMAMCAALMVIAATLRHKNSAK